MLMVVLLEDMVNGEENSFCEENRSWVSSAIESDSGRASKKGAQHQCGLLLMTTGHAP